MLPNVQVDGTLNIDGEVFIPSGATFGDLDAQIALKAPLASPAFTGNPTAPTPTAGDNSTKVATTAFVKSKSEADSIGVGQTWQDVTASRVAGTTYTNSTGKPIQIIVYVTGPNDCLLTVGGLLVDSVYNDTSNEGGSVSAIIPNGTTYSASSKLTWLELR